MCEAVSEASDNGVSAKNIHRRNGQFQFVHQGDGSTLNDQHVNGPASQLGSQRRYAQQIIVTKAISDFEVVVITVPKFGKASSECLKERCKTRFSLSGKPSDAKNFGRRVHARAASRECDKRARRSQKSAAIHCFVPARS